MFSFDHMSRGVALQGSLGTADRRYTSKSAGKNDKKTEAVMMRSVVKIDLE